MRKRFDVTDRTEEEIQETRKAAMEYSKKVYDKRKIKSDNNMVYMMSILLAMAFYFAPK